MILIFIVEIFQIHPNIPLSWVICCKISVIDAKMVRSFAVYHLKIDDYNVRTFALHTDGLRTIQELMDWQIALKFI